MCLLPWFVVQLKNGGVASAVLNLKRQGIEVFAPRIATDRLGRHGVKAVLRPLFPGYLFVMIARPDQIRAVNHTLGVRRIVATATGAALPRPLPDAFVDELRAECDGEGIVQARDRLEPGDRLALVSGPLRGLVAEVLALSEDGRVKVLLELLGRPVVTAVGRQQLDLVARKAS